MLSVVLVVALAAACQGTEGASPTTAAPTTASGSLTTPESTAPISIIETEPLMERLGLVTDLFNGASLGEGEYQSAFTADFIANVPHADMVEVAEQVAATGSGWEIAEFEERDDLAAVVLVSAPDSEPFRVQIALELVVPHRIATLLIQPAEPPVLDDHPADLETAADRLAELGTTRLVAAEVVDGECAPILDRGAEQPAPIGSVVKLYVLGAVADAVEAGDLAWDDPVEIVEGLKSVPTGVLQDEEEGTELSVREMAEAMISISDNTATDHLIGLVGRETVESALDAYGMADPSLDIPLMNTLELTALKVGPASGLATQWLAADEAGRRAILEQISDITPADIPIAEFDRPIMPDQIEWFATPLDLCRVLVELGERGEPTTQILAVNPGVPDEDGLFEEVWFKGGSEPGLVAMSYLVERPDGRRFVLAGSVVDPEEDFDQLEATLLFGAMRDLLADQ